MEVEFLNRTFLGNTLETYLWCLGILLVGFVFKQLISKVFSAILFRSFKKYSGEVSVEQFHNLLKKPFAFFFLLVIGYIAFDRLQFPIHWNLAPDDKFGLRMIIIRLYQILVLFSITWIFLRIVDFFGLILLYKASKTTTRVDDQLIPFFKDGFKIFIVILSFFFMLASVFHVNIVTLIGGLGIGGLAVALAGKETLENLFGSFTIFLDKPFIVGDHVKVGAISGHVERIGLRSTRIRTLDKSLVTVPNKKMTDAEMENITERTFWRCRQEIGLVYNTAGPDLKNILSQVKQYLDNHSKIKEGSTVNFDSFGQSALGLLIVYFVRTADGDEFQKVKEEINFKLVEIIRSNNSDFAFPTTTVFLEKPDL